MTEYRVTLGKGVVDRDFVFVGGPLEQPDGLDDLFRALGLACAQWSRLEQHIDAVLIHVNNREHSDSIFDPDHPVSFRKKIDLLKRWFNQHPALSGLTDDVRLLTSKLKQLNRHRNNLVHGTLESWDASTKTSTLRTLKCAGQDGFTLATHKYTLKAIETVAELTAASNRFLSAISREVFTEDALERLRTP